MMKASDEEFKSVRDYIYKICGIFINEDKKYLVEQRLEPVIREAGMESFHDFSLNMMDLNDSIHNTVIEAITTNETSFFRDKHPFETFRDFLLPKLGELIHDRKAGGARVDIWCAAASTGQEPYSLAMMVKEYVNSHPGLSLSNFSILATDISSRVLEQAGSGRYTRVEVSRGLTPEKRQKNFIEDGQHWVLKEEIRRMVEFKRLNITRPFQNLGMFDLIFCRNILIYFDDETKKRIISQFRQMLKKNGILLLGACENLNNLSTEFHTSYHNQTIIYSCK